MLRCLIFLLLLAITTYAERIDMECGYVERTNRGLQCEFNNIFTFKTTEVFVTESNKSIDAVSFQQSELYQVPFDLFRNFKLLKHLDVEESRLKNIFPENFQNAKELKYFLARFNELEELKNRVFINCPQLKFIVLQYNQISIIEPNAFEGLLNLEAIYLDFNKLKTLPDGVLQPMRNLIHLSLANNNITHIPRDSLVLNDKLETLNFAHNSLKTFDEKQFESLPNLEKIDFENNLLTKLDLRTCKSTEINIDGNGIEKIELNKWTRFLTAWGNPVKSFILHEHYGTGRNYNLSFVAVREMIFFVNEHCCSVENLENFEILIGAFGDLSEKGFNTDDWSCKFLQTIGYQTPKGLVVNNVCTKISQDSSTFTTSDSPTFKMTEESTNVLATPETTTPIQRGNIVNPEDLIESEEIESTTKPRESIEDNSDTRSMFNVDIETLDETRTTTADPDAAVVQEIFPTTVSYEKTNEKGILKTVKRKLVGWKNKAVDKWNSWVG